MGLAQIKMPQLGESVTEGTVDKWLKHEGDFVKRDEPIVEVVTDKVNAEIPSPFEGKLVKISATEGEVVRVGAVIAQIEVAGAGSLSEVGIPISEKSGCAGCRTASSSSCASAGAMQASVITRVKASRVVFNRFTAAPFRIRDVHTFTSAGPSGPGQQARCRSRRTTGARAPPLTDSPFTGGVIDYRARNARHRQSMRYFAR